MVLDFARTIRCVSRRDIAKLIGRNHTVVSREVKRNKPQFSSYNAELAQRAAKRRARITNKRKLDKDKKLYDYVVSKLEKDWSPEQIAGRLKNHFPSNLKTVITHETIYQYIYHGGINWRKGTKLYNYLRRAKSNRQKRYSRKPRKIIIPERISIHLRPEEIKCKATFGHWESDTMFCKQRKGLSVQYERKSQLLRIHKLTNMKAEETKEAIIKTIDSLPLYLIKSVTFDNGGENAKHFELKKDFDLKTYFCDPYSAWQKGGVENVNGLLRQYLPKKTDLKEMTDEEILKIQEKLNNRPRKALNYLTPNEIIEIQGGALNY